MITKQSADIIIWRKCSIGALDAETDRALLQACFVNNGCLDHVRDTDSPASMIIGRTGAGKSATLIRLEQICDNVIEINPSDLSFKYVENSTVLKFFREAGVNLDVFYRMLWRHVLITELLKARYGWNSELVVQNWFDGFLEKFRRDQAKSRALRYLKEWGDRFWEDTEVRVREVTERVEADLKASISSGGFLGKLSSEAGAKLSEEEKSEISTRGSEVVNKIQMKELSKLVTFLAEEVFDDVQQPFYITIDNLDQNWVAAGSKYLLIRSLIEEIKTFRKIRNVKIIAVLRQDLLEKVYNETRDGGFQEEKYEDYYAPLRWTEKDLEALVEIRVNEVFKRKYTGMSVKSSDVLPKDRGSERSFSYILERTFLRPRDVISFINECFLASEGKSRITWAAMHAAEEVYSQKRLRSVLDEWTQLFPSLKHVIDLVRGLADSFTSQDIKSDVIDEVIIKIAADNPQDEIGRLAVAMMSPEGHVRREQILAQALYLMYHVGILGIKPNATSSFSWVYREGRRFNSSDINARCHLRIHKMFWRELGVAVRPYSYDAN